MGTTFTVEEIKYNKQKVVFAANSRGQYSDKFNRAAKLAVNYKQLENKMYGLAERGILSNTETSRCAVACILMMQTGIRIGNETSAEGYMTKPHPNSKKESEFAQTFGLTTLRAEHVNVKPSGIVMDFTGKKQIHNSFKVQCNLLSSWVKHLKKMEMPTLFGISDYQLTKFVKKYVGKQYTPKDFRTMKANLVAGEFVAKNFKVCETKKEFNGLLKDMYETVSTHLHNTPGVCKRSYVSEMLGEYLMITYLNK